jgi:hypothetical protein
VECVVAFQFENFRHILGLGTVQNIPSPVQMELAVGLLRVLETLAIVAAEIGQLFVTPSSSMQLPCALNAGQALCDRCKPRGQQGMVSLLDRALLI